MLAILWVYAVGFKYIGRFSISFRKSAIFFGIPLVLTSMIRSFHLVPVLVKDR